MAPNEARKNNEGSDFVTGLATWAKREPFIRMFPIYRKHILLTLATAGVILFCAQFKIYAAKSGR